MLVFRRILLLLVVLINSVLLCSAQFTITSNLPTGIKYGCRTPSDVIFTLNNPSGYTITSVAWRKVETDNFVIKTSSPTTYQPIFSTAGSYTIQAQVVYSGGTVEISYGTFTVYSTSALSYTVTNNGLSEACAGYTSNLSLSLSDASGNALTIPSTSIYTWTLKNATTSVNTDFSSTNQLKSSITSAGVYTVSNVYMKNTGCDLSKAVATTPKIGRAHV